MGKRMISALLLGLLLCGCGLKPPLPHPVETVDPYAGMIQVDNGLGTKMWVKEYEELAVNPYLDRADWETMTPGQLRSGIDVSEHQGEIDWDVLLAENTVDFAILRVGYRGYGAEGPLREDAFFRRNLAFAAANGLDVGLYFFSQATTTAEAEEEADFVLEQLAKLTSLDQNISPACITLPIFFDWEHIDFDEARTDNVENGTLTEMAVAFCERIRAAGYTPGVYTYRSLAYHSYDLSRLADYKLWIGALGEVPDFYYAHEFWQRAVVTDVAGIKGELDINVWFCPESSTTESPALYADVLAQYADMVRNDFYDGADDSRFGADIGLEIRQRKQDIYSALYDIDGNGTPELVIAGGEKEQPWNYDIYAYDGSRAVHLFPDMNFGYRTNFTLYESGVIEVSYSSSAADSGVEFYKIGDDGVTPELLDSFSTVGQPKDGASVSTYYHGENEISENEYSAALQSYALPLRAALDWQQIQ